MTGARRIPPGGLAIVLTLAVVGGGSALVWASRRSEDSLRSPDPVSAEHGVDLDRRIVTSSETIRDSLRLSTGRHTPWEQVHALMAWGPQCPIRSTDDRSTTLLDSLIHRPVFLGEPFYEVGEGGIRVRKETQINRFESHANEFLAIYALAGVPLDEPIAIEGKGRLRVRDLLDTAKREYYAGQLPSFLLIAVGLYESMEASWTDRTGTAQSALGLLAAQQKADDSDQPCGGAHGYLALAVARNLLAEPRSGSPRNAELVRTLDAALLARWKQCVAGQKNDGSFDPSLFGNRDTGSPTQGVYVTGHTLEWVAEVAPREILESEACKACVSYLLRTLTRPEVARQASVGEIGHALHGLSRYRERLGSRVDRVENRPINAIVPTGKP